MRSCILCVHIENSSLWVEFVNKNRCISVSLVSKEVFNLDNFDNPHNSFLWPEYFIDYSCKNGFHVRLWQPPCVYFSTHRQYTAVQICIHLWKKFPCIVLAINRLLNECQELFLRWKTTVKSSIDYFIIQVCWEQHLYIL